MLLCLTARATPTNQSIGHERLQKIVGAIDEALIKKLYKKDKWA